MANKKKVIDNFGGDFYYLSNFSPHGFQELNGAYWKTNEHYFQAAKTKHPEWRYKIWKADSAWKAKEYGNLAPLIKGWDYRKLMVMLRGLEMKFTQHEDIAKKLKSLEGYYLIEGNTWHDNYWGDCICAACQNTKGQNNLGDLLMVLRDKIL
jgi:ribA/ribD-fused uncharacterized protein